MPEDAEGSPRSKSAQRTVDARTDIWAFGAMLLRDADGPAPFHGRRGAVLRLGARASLIEQPCLPMFLGPRRVHQAVSAQGSEHRISDIGDVALALEGVRHRRRAAKAACGRSQTPWRMRSRWSPRR